MRYHIGVDIGKEGAICIRDTEATGGVLPVVVFKMPKIKDQLDYKELLEIFEPYQGKNAMVVFEKLGVIFGSSKQTAFSMGHQAGAVEMLCTALKIPFTKVQAKIWQKEMFVGVEEITKPSKSGKSSTRDTKAMALLAAKRLFPNQKLTFGDKATKPHDGLIDALLMSEYSIRKF